MESGVRARDCLARRPVEAIVNGHPVASQRLTADGSPRDLAFDIPIQRSSWIALRSSALLTRTLSLSWSASGRSVRRKEAPSGASRVSISAGRRKIAPYQPGRAA